MYVRNVVLCHKINDLASGHHAKLLLHNAVCALWYNVTVAGVFMVFERELQLRALARR
jgi:hypothetical protein